MWKHYLYKTEIRTRKTFENVNPRFKPKIIYSRQNKYQITTFLNQK